MKCEDVDRLVLLAIFLTVIGDALGFVAELLAQRCAKKEEAESEKANRALITRLDEFERRLRTLENN